jgi:hypothetical protein
MIGEREKIMHAKISQTKNIQEAVREWLFSIPLIAERQAQIIILEILQCIPVVIIFAFPRSKSGIIDLIL